MESRYQPTREVRYKVRMSHKRLNWNIKLEYHRIVLASPDIKVVNGNLILKHTLAKKQWVGDSKLLHHWGPLVKTLREEAEELYPEFKGKVIILEDEE